MCIGRVGVDRECRQERQSGNTMRYLLGPRRIFLEKLPARIERNTVESHLIMEVRIGAFPSIAYVGNPLVLPDFLSFHNVNLR